ncbi:MAG: dCMP deaminase family protein [Minisyncoccia bacterium]
MIEPRKNHISWDECFMRIAHIIAERSKDPSTQTGAVIVTKDNIVVGIGYNGFPRNIDSGALPWDREGEFENTKYAYVCHAEENAIYNSNNSTRDCKIYCTLFPCNECAKTIIQNGIKEVIYENDKYAETPSVKAAKKMFDLARVTYRQFISPISLK